MTNCIIKKRETFTRSRTFRLSDKLNKKISAMAGMYADGDESAWIRHCIDNYTPKVVRKLKRKITEKNNPPSKKKGASGKSKRPLKKS